jgi:hypothetical protein
MAVEQSTPHYPISRDSLTLYGRKKALPVNSQQGKGRTFTGWGVNLLPENDYHYSE